MRILVLLFCLTASALAQPVAWTEWDGAFERAEKDHKLVILDLEAVWCHWCHVMDKTTYQDSQVQKLLAEGFVTVKVDQDNRPDLSLRYQAYGWPATVIFDARGRELAVLSGYQSPEEMRTALQAALDDPTPMAAAAESAPKAGPLTADILQTLKGRHYRYYDDERGGWGRIHKFVNPPVVEYCLRRSLEGSADDRRMARQTLTANLALIDPVWGGVYQYSDSGVWDSPHYEKIMSTQAGNLRVYSLAYAQYQDPDYRAAADAVAGYLLQHLRSPQGAFYTSQDADLQQGKKAHDYFALNDAARRERGIPRIDQHLYARENGWAIEALALYAGITHNSDAQQAALEAADWVLAHRLKEGGFLHDADSKDYFLGDTLACGSAFLALYRLTGDQAWLQRATASADFIQAHFGRAAESGYPASTVGNFRDRQEQIALCRFANLLYHHTGVESYRQMAHKALDFFATEGATDEFNPGGVLLAAEELNTDPLHATVVGEPESSLNLVRAALACPTTYYRLDRVAPGLPAPPFTQTEYPVLDKAALFVCSGKRCSAPVFEAEKVRKVLLRQ